QPCPMITPAQPSLPDALGKLDPSAPSPLAPVVPADAPFADDQRQWLNGLLTGLTVLARAAHDRGQGNTGPDAPAVPLTILYGSQSGNAEALSKDLRKHATAAGFKPDVKELNDLDLADLPGVGRAVIVCSTFGEGDPPDNAQKFFDKLLADDAPALGGLAYSVCGLGDSSYTHFNKSGRDLDARLAELGATRVADFVACDVAYEDDYAEWKTAVFASDEFKVAPGSSAAVPADNDAEPAEKYTKNDPFFGTILGVHNLNRPGSAKEVNHVEISLAGSGLEYTVGDALGLWPSNCTGLVQETLDAGGYTGRETVQLKTGPTPLRAALLDRLDLCTVTAKTCEALCPGIEPAPGIAVPELLETLDPAPEPQALVDALRPLQPRLYSIASSHHAHPGEVHLTVGAVRYETHGKPRKGVASTFLADRCPFGSRVGVYLQRSAHFHIPPDDVPLIMIGPGTGIAPFRAFLEDRATRFADTPTRNWLFFGDQHEASDFLYRDEIEAWLDVGVLERFDAAWSRDQAEKIYVQNKMTEHGAELWDWLQQGAAVYVCGDASRMAKDVDAALHQVVETHGQMSAEDAAAYVESLKENHRYQRDVY
ncbi:MAG: sulfite reductase flavoprotein subunit alpha, partial [Planctomycetota bacterium]